MKLVPRDYDLVVSNRPSCQYFYPTSVEVLLISQDFELRDRISYSLRFWNVSIRISFVYAPFQHLFSLPRNLYTPQTQFHLVAIQRGHKCCWTGLLHFFERLSGPCQHHTLLLTLRRSIALMFKILRFKRDLNKFTAGSKLGRLRLAISNESTINRTWYRLVTKNWPSTSYCYPYLTGGTGSFFVHPVCWA